LEAVLLLLGEEDDADQLALGCDEISPDHADGNTISLAILLEFYHALLVADLNDGCPLEDECVLVDVGRVCGQFIETVCLLDHGD
jgi:hypothetical protein